MLNLKAVDINTGKTVQPGTTVFDSRRNEYVLEAPTAATVPGKSGKVRLTDEDGNNTYLYAHIVGLRVETVQGYITAKDGDDVSVLIYGSQLSAKDADKIARQLLPGVKVVESQSFTSGLKERLYAKACK